MCVCVCVVDKVSSVFVNIGRSLLVCSLYGTDKNGLVSGAGEDFVEHL